METKKQLLRNKQTFEEYYKNNINTIKPIKKPVEKPIEFQFLDLLHKLDDKNLDFLDENLIDDYIEELLLEE